MKILFFVIYCCIWLLAKKLGRNQMTTTGYCKSERDHGHRNFKKEPLKLCQNLTCDNGMT